MTRQQTQTGVQVALQNLAKKSVRKACKDAGISVTTLYNKTSPEEREAAMNGNHVAPQSLSVVAPPVKRGRPARVPEQNDEIDFKYVAKLQKALLDRILEKE